MKNLRKKKAKTLCVCCKRKVGHKKGCNEYVMGYRKGQSDIYNQLGLL